MKCEICGKKLKPGEPVFHRNGQPAQHRKHYNSSRSAAEDERWSRLLAGLREGDMVAMEQGMAWPGPVATPARHRKPDMEEAERMQYASEERLRRTRR